MHKGRERDADAFEFAVLFNDHVDLKPELRKLLEEEHLTGNFRAHHLRRCEQLHKRRRNFDPRPNAGWLAIELAAEIEQTPLSKLSTWASASDRAGSACLNSFLGLISGAPARVKPPRHAAAR
jgi:hypothetical protein